MVKLLGNSRYVVLIAVIGLLVGSIAVYVFGGIMTVTVIVEAFQEEFNAEGARAFSSELIELIDLFLLGTVMFMTSVGLFELFVDPEIPIPEWLSVANLDQLKSNLANAGTQISKFDIEVGGFKNYYEQHFSRKGSGKAGGPASAAYEPILDSSELMPDQVINQQALTFYLGRRINCLI